MSVNFTTLFASLDIMWKGMVGLFAVCGFIMLFIMVLSKFMIKKKQRGT